MKRKVVISKTAEKKLEKLFVYLSKKWSEKIKVEFIQKLDHNIEITEVSHPIKSTLIRHKIIKKVA